MTKKRYILLSVAALLLAAIGTLLTSCDRSGDDPVSSGQQQPDNTGGGSNDNADGNALRIVAAKQPFTDETGTRADTDFGGGTYATTFETGDEIGVIAVRDGGVLDGCNNVKLTYNATGSKWEGDNPVYFKDGATYFAYSPYRAVMDGKKSTQEIFDAFDVSSDQSTKTLFTANDLMISTTCTANKTAKTLTIAFEHKLAMLEIGTLHGRTTSSWVYPIKNTIPLTYSIGGATTGRFFRNSAEGVGAPYRCLVKPAANVSLSLSYMMSNPDGSLFIQWNASNQSFVTGQRRKIIPSKTRDIIVGDYYYSDGSIFPSNVGVTPPGQDDGCIGVVFALGSTGIAAGDNIDYYSRTGLTGGIHGYVSALSSTGPTIWQDGNTVMIWTSTDKTSYRGFRNGVSWVIDKHIPNFKSSPTSSGWYMPSLAQLKAMNATRSICEPNMKKVGGGGYLHPSAIDYQDGVWIWSNTCLYDDGTALYNDMWNIWFKEGTGTNGEERGFRTSVSGNKYHSSVAHFCLTF